jgi:hypothetical protein
MRTGLDPFSFLVLSIGGWINQRQQQVIEYLIEENASFENTSASIVCDSRTISRRLAARAKKLSRKVIAPLEENDWKRTETAGIVVQPSC